MSGPRPGPFEPLEPPRGGLATLRGRLEREARRRVSARRTWALATIAVVAALAAVVLMRPVPDVGAGPFPDGFDLVRMRVGLVEPPDEPVTVAANRRHLFAVRRVPMADDEVVFYRVASVAPAVEEETPGAP